MFLRFWNKPNHFQNIGNLRKHTKLCFFKLFWKLNFIIKSQIKSRRINSGSFEICFKQCIFKILENKWNVQTLFSNHFKWTLLGFLKSNQNQFQNYFRNEESKFSILIFFWRLNTHVQVLFGIRLLGKLNQIK